MRNRFSQQGARSSGVTGSLAKLLIASAALLMVIILIFAILSSLGGISGVQYGIQRVVLPPNVQVTSKNARSGMIGLDYTVYVDVSVHNSGGAGTVTVWVSVTQGSSQWTKSQMTRLEPRESRDLTFVFREVGFWSSRGWSYRVWIT